MASPEPLFFRTSAKFRIWLARNHSAESELWVGFHKVDSGRESITYPEALDEALCYGWIDGVRKSIDGSSYMIRFTPRKPKSYWSKVNIGKANQLIEAGRMTAAGRAVFEERDKNANRYSYELRGKGFTPDLEKRFRQVPAAWKFFETQAPWYKRTTSFWVMSAKKEETRMRRLQQLIEVSAKQRRLDMLTSNSKKDK